MSVVALVDIKVTVEPAQVNICFMCLFATREEVNQVNTVLCLIT